MNQVNVTEFRQNLPSYLARVAMGEQFQITVNGQVVARLESDKDQVEQARHRLLSYRNQCTLGDVLSPLPAEWLGDSGNL